MHSTSPLDNLRPSNPSPLDSWRALLKWVAAALVIVGCGITLSVWLIIKLTGDSWHWGTLLLFSPRWLGLIPWAAVIPLLGFSRPWQRWIWVTTGVIGGISLMGFNLPVPTWPQPSIPHVRVITCNVQKDEITLPEIESLIVEVGADIVFLQEFNSAEQMKWPKGWVSFSEGGQCIGSRFPINRTAVCQKDPTADGSRITGLLATLQLEERSLNVASIHLSTPRMGLGDLLGEDGISLEGSFERLKKETDSRSAESEWTRLACDRFGAMDLIAGDFNMPVDSRILTRDWSSYRDAFVSAGWGLGYTKYENYRGWQVRARIDHILISPELSTRWCRVGPDVGSDHRPVLAEIELD